MSGDELKWVRCCTNDDLVAMASQNGMVILSSCDVVSHFPPWGPDPRLLFNDTDF